MASFAPPKPPLGSREQESSSAARRRHNSSPHRSRSPSPSFRELLKGSGYAFNSKDAAHPLSPTESVNNCGGSSGGGSVITVGSAPTPDANNETVEGRGGFSASRGGGSVAGTAAGAAAATAAGAAKLPVVPRTGDGRPASVHFSSANSAAANITAAAIITTPRTAANTTTTTTATTTHTTTNTATAAAASKAVPTFSEILRGVASRNGDIPLEPFARARIRAVEEGWARQEAERQEQDKRRRFRVLSGATLLALGAVLVCRFIGVGIAISGPGGIASPAPPPGRRKWGTKRRASEPTTTPPKGVLSRSAREMPAIVGSKDELAAALELAGLKRPKPADLDRAWSALASGRNRGGGGGSGGRGGTSYYVAGGVMAARVVVAGLLRNPDLGVILAVTLVAFALICHMWWVRTVACNSRGDSVARGKGGEAGAGGAGGGGGGRGGRGGEGGARGAGEKREVTNGSRSPRVGGYASSGG